MRLYGAKPPAEVMARVREVMDLLMARQVKAVLIACNTATTWAAATLRAELDLPIIGMEPALKPASELRHGGRILVMATPLTLRLPKFQALMARYGEGAIPLPCPGLMELVEEGELDGPEVEDYLIRLLTPYRHTPLDAVVLGWAQAICLFAGRSAAYVTRGNRLAGRKRRHRAPASPGAGAAGFPPPGTPWRKGGTAHHGGSGCGVAAHGALASFTEYAGNGPINPKYNMIIS